MTTPDDRFTERARTILRDSPLIDGHNDLAYALRERVGGVRTSTVDLRTHVDGLDTDIPRLREGGVGPARGPPMGQGHVTDASLMKLAQSCQ